MITVVGETKIQPTSISFPSTAVAVNVGETRQLTPTVLPADAEYTLTWSINDRSVATVSQDGLLTGKSEGYADLKVSADNGVYTMLRIVVSTPSASSVSVTPSSVSLVEGNTGYLSASVYPSSANQSVSWTSDNTSVATVSSYGKVTAVSPGSCRITAATSNGHTDYCSVTVTRKIVPPTSISLPESVDMTVDDKTTLSPTIIPVDAETTITWASSDETIASVTSDGLVSALSEGSCRITAVTSNDLTAYCTIHVQKAAVEPAGISIISNIELTIGEKYDVIADIEPVDASTTLHWESDNNTVASVDNGSITALSEGECNVTVTTSNNLYAVCHVVVKSTSVPDDHEITSDWVGTYRMTSSIVRYRESTYVYPSEFDLTIVERDGDYYITSIIGMDCTSGYPYEGMKLIIESSSKAYIDLEYNDGLGWKDISGSHIDNLHSMSPSPEYSYNPQPVYLTRTNNDDILIQDFYVFAFGSDTDYEQEKEVLFTNCSGMKDSSGMSGIPDMTTDEDSPHVEVYNLNGVRVFSGEKSGIPQLEKGVYIFCIGNEIHKVLIE